MAEKILDLYTDRPNDPTTQSELPFKVRLSVIGISCTLVLLLYSIAHSPYLRYNIAEIFGIFSSLFLLFLSIGMIKLVDLEEDLLWFIPLGFFIFSYVILKGYLVVGGLDISSLELHTKGKGGVVTEWFFKNPFIVSVLTVVPFIIAGSSRYDPKAGSLRIGFVSLVMLFVFELGAVSWQVPTLDHLIQGSIIFYYQLMHVMIMFIALPFAVLLRYQHIPLDYLGLRLPIINRFFSVVILWCSGLLILLLLRASMYGITIESYAFNEWIIKIAYVAFFISLSEELMFCSLLIGALNKTWSQVFGKNLTVLTLIISSLFVGMLHYWGGLYGVTLSFATGFFFGLTFIYTRSLVTPVLLHALLDIVIGQSPL